MHFLCVIPLSLSTPTHATNLFCLLSYSTTGHEDTDVQHGGNEGGGGGGHLPQSNSATSLNHLAVMGAPHHQNSGSSFGDVSSSTDLQHKVRGKPDRDMR